MLSKPNQRVFVAGAGGVIGRVLCRLLLEDGWAVTGTARSPDKAAALQAIGVIPVVVDVFDAHGLLKAVAATGAEIVVHQLTDLPPGLDPVKMADARIRNARIREIGTRNLVAAALSCGVRRMVAQSVAFAYAPGPLPYHEEAPLNVAVPDEVSALSARAVASLERQVLEASLSGVILRYGKLYGPGTGFDSAPAGGPVHVDAAADAARRAATTGETGIYNIAEDDGTVSSFKAKRELGWHADFRVGPNPRR